MKLSILGRHTKSDISQEPTILTQYDYSDILISMNYVQKITKVRERGQLTVPYEIREALNWPEKELMVQIETTNSGFKVQRVPISHPQYPKKKLTEKEWTEIFRHMKRVSRLGKQGVNLAEALRKDRDTHF